MEGRENASFSLSYLGKADEGCVQPVAVPLPRELQDPWAFAGSRSGSAHFPGDLVKKRFPAS